MPIQVLMLQLYQIKKRERKKTCSALRKASYALVLPATNLRFTTQKLKINKTFIGNQGVAINSLIVNI